MAIIAEVRPLPGYRVQLKFTDGVQGVVDLSALAGKGVFACWIQGQRFNDVTIGSAGELQWGGEADLCPDQLYLEVTGKKPEDLFPALKQKPAHA